MLLPNGEAAIVDIIKLVDYCLNHEHPRGKHKARVFGAALGLTREHAEPLRSALLRAAASAEAVRTGSDGFGDRYVLQFEMAGPKGTATVLSSWIVRRNETAPRLTSCFVK